MAQIGQIVYDLNGQYSHNKETLDNNLFGNGIIGVPDLIPTGNVITKLGVQASPGTQLKINCVNAASPGMSIIVGRSGIYELDERINVHQLSIIRTPLYQLDVEQTQQAQADSIINLANFVDMVESNPLPSTWDEKAMTDWIGLIQTNSGDNITQAMEYYYNGYIKFLQGKHGIYEPVMINNIPAYEPVKNLIIDYIYEQLN